MSSIATGNVCNYNIMSIVYMFYKETESEISRVYFSDLAKNIVF